MITLHFYRSVLYERDTKYIIIIIILEYLSEMYLFYIKTSWKYHQIYILFFKIDDKTVILYQKDGFIGLEMGGFKQKVFVSLRWGTKFLGFSQS